MNKTVFITGATSGIGEATAHLFAQNKFNIIITGRRTVRLDALAALLHEKYGVTVLLLHFDVRNQATVEAAISSMPESWKNIDILVNNAGLAAGKDAIQHGKRENWERMIDTNVK